MPGKLTELGRAIGARARAAAAAAADEQAARVTTKDSRAARASWGSMLVQLGQLLGSVGAHLLAGAYEDAESTIDQAHDAGYEQRRHDEAEAAAVRVQPAADVEDQGDGPGAVDVEDQGDGPGAGDMAAAVLSDLSRRYDDSPGDGS